MARRLLGGMMWTTINGVVSRVLALTSGIVLARVFGASDYGAYGMIQGTVGMFGAFSGLGVSLTATKFVAEYRQNRGADASHVIALSNSVALVSGAFFSLVLFAMSKTLAIRVLGSPALEAPLRLSALMLFLSNVSGAQSGVLSGFESFRLLALVSIGGGVVSSTAAVAGGVWFGLQGAVWGLVLGNVASCLFGHLAVAWTSREHGVAVRLWGGLEARHLLMKFSIPATLVGILVMPVTWACSAILAGSPNGLAQVGLFNAANQWFGLVMFLPGLLGQTMVPILSERLGQDDGRASRRVVGLSVALNGSAAAVLVVCTWIFGESVARLYGRGFEATPAVLHVALITGGLVAVQSPVGHVLVASGRMWQGFIMNLGWAVCFIGCTTLLVHRGAVGLAEARLAAYIVHGTWTCWYGVRLLRGRSPISLHPRTYEPAPGDSNPSGGVG